MSTTIKIKYAHYNRLHPNYKNFMIMIMQALEPNFHSSGDLIIEENESVEMITFLMQKSEVHHHSHGKKKHNTHEHDEVEETYNSGEH